MMGISYYDDPDGKSLQKKLNELPEGSRIVSIYARGPVHCAWVLPPEPALAPAADEVSAAAQKSKKKGK